MKRVTIHDYRTGVLIGSASIDFDTYAGQSVTGAVRAGDWLTEDGGSIAADLTVWFEEEEEEEGDGDE